MHALTRQTCFRRMMKMSSSVESFYLLMWHGEGMVPSFIIRSHLKADFSGLSKQRLCCQVGVWICTPQVRRAARGLDSNLIGRRRSQPWRRVRCWAKSTRVHGWIVKVLHTSSVPLPFHCPTPTKMRCGGSIIMWQHKQIFSSAKRKGWIVKRKLRHTVSCYA